MSLLDRLNASQIITVGLTAFHGGCAFLALVHRPNMLEIIEPYRAFHDFMPTSGWGIWMLVTAILLMLAPIGSGIRILGQIFSVFILTISAVMVSAVVGLNWGTISYSVLAWASLLVMGETTGEWLDRRPWYRRMTEKRRG